MLVRLAPRPKLSLPWPSPTWPEEANAADWLAVARSRPVQPVALYVQAHHGMAVRAKAKAEEPNLDRTLRAMRRAPPAEPKPTSGSRHRRHEVVLLDAALNGLFAKQKEPAIRED
jgi:hypothetical protein